MTEALRNDALTQNTLWVFLGQALRLSLQALYFVEIARSLGPTKYGAFVGVVALVGIVYPFGDFGSGAQLMMNVSRDKTCFANYWGRALVTIGISSTILLIVVLAASHFALPSGIPVRLILLVSVSDLAGLNISTTCVFAFMALDKMKSVAFINVLMSATRVAAASILIIIHPHPSALQWGYAYCFSSAATAVTATLLVFSRIGLPRFNWRRSRADLREGFYFSSSLSAQTVYNDIDKTMLARLGTLEATGIYGAAYRIIDVCFVPVSSLLSASFSSFFRKGADGIKSCLVYAKPLLLRAFGYSVLACLIVLSSAELVPYVLGPNYGQTAEALRWLAVLPILKTLHYFFSNALTCAGFQGFRTCVQVAVALFNVLINFWLIPLYSWRGAAWSSIASDGMLACGVCIIALILSRRSHTTLEVTKAEVPA